jgi:putative transposase
MTAAQQLPLAFARPGWGGARVGAGRKPGHARSVAHRTRAVHRRYHPVHVTLRAREGLPPLRERALFGAVKRAIRGASRSPAVGAAFRVTVFSVQSNHLHLVVEAHDSSTLSRGMQGLSVRVARAINGVLGARGRVFRERYHARELRTPLQVRNALVYVLMNAKKHGGHFARTDAFSSAPWFGGFAERVVPPTEESPVVAARTWLGAHGWRRRGLVRFDERPRAPD